MTPTFVVCYLSAAVLQVAKHHCTSIFVGTFLQPKSANQPKPKLNLNFKKSPLFASRRVLHANTQSGQSLWHLPAALLQVLILLYVASLMVQWLWRRGLDPDNVSIPYLTALGDLLGTAFLALSFRLILTVQAAGTRL